MSTGNGGPVSLMIFDGFGGDGNTIDFDHVGEARAWAAKYMAGFKHARVFLVWGKAERLEAPKAEVKP
jgi:hypothetical protein